MQALIQVILPVFLLIGAGYLAVWRRALPSEAVGHLMSFAQNFAIPCLLFRAIWQLDLHQSFDWRLLLAFYAGALICFFVGFFGARHLFGRPPEDAIAIGFACLFSNSLLLGLPITERAYGEAALASNYAIISVHAPFCYAVGITAMELARARGAPRRHLPGRVVKAMFSNALIFAILLGFAMNLGGIGLPGVVTEALDMLIRAALPVALFGLGGVLVQYRPEGDLRVILMVCAIALLLHPTLVWILGSALHLSREAFRSAVVTSAMAPGVNAYLFAHMYGRAMRVNASSVLIATALTILSAWFWLWALP
ncbi:AEC family transporter [Aquicoccus sp. SCR17]|nr:AEC family transporter [Carideicomes alvinocaridis]